MSKTLSNPCLGYDLGQSATTGPGEPINWTSVYYICVHVSRVRIGHPADRGQESESQISGGDMEDLIAFPARRDVRESIDATNTFVLRAFVYDRSWYCGGMNTSPMSVVSLALTSTTGNFTSSFAGSRTNIQPCTKCLPGRTKRSSNLPSASLPVAGLW
jgi:hypothetical protein